MSLEKISLDGFTDAELDKELLRRKNTRIALERLERESRSDFLFNSLNELESLVSSYRDKDSRLIKFLAEVREYGYWDNDYDIELRLVEYPSLD
jgi:hypothetical protein